MFPVELQQGGEVLDGPDHLRNVGVLVVVPGNDLHLAGAVAQVDDHGLGGIEQGAETHADDVGGNDLVGVVAEGLGGLSLHLGVDISNRGGAFHNGVQDGGGAGGAPMNPSSTVRCQAHNDELRGSVKNSRHVSGRAMDFRIRGWGSERTLALVRKQPEVRYAYAIDESYVHMDVE